MVAKRGLVKKLSQRTKLSNPRKSSVCILPPVGIVGSSHRVSFLKAFVAESNLPRKKKHKKVKSQLTAYNITAFCSDFLVGFAVFFSLESFKGIFKLYHWSYLLIFLNLYNRQAHKCQATLPYPGGGGS